MIREGIYDEFRNERDDFYSSDSGSDMEEYDSDFEASEWFGDEDIWDEYKKYPKYQDSLLKAMDNFYEQKTYLASKPELYSAGSDNYHPNRIVHEDLARKIAETIIENEKR